jgi:hypothetical protein
MELGQSSEGMKATGSITNIEPTENSPSQWANLFNSPLASGAPVSGASSSNGFSGTKETAKAYNMMGTHEGHNPGSNNAYTQNKKSIFEYYNANGTAMGTPVVNDPAVNGADGPPGAGLTKEMEALFNNINATNEPPAWTKPGGVGSECSGRCGDAR